MGRPIKHAAPANQRSLARTPPPKKLKKRNRQKKKKKKESGAKGPEPRSVSSDPSAAHRWRGLGLTTHAIPLDNSTAQLSSAQSRPARTLSVNKQHQHQPHRRGSPSSFPPSLYRHTQASPETGPTEPSNLSLFTPSQPNLPTCLITSLSPPSGDPLHRFGKEEGPTVDLETCRLSFPLRCIRSSHVTFHQSAQPTLEIRNPDTATAS